MEFFRHCPECGRRFHVKLEFTKMTHYEKKTIPSKRSLSQHTGINTAAGRGRIDQQWFRAADAAILIEGKPIILEAKEFDYTYKCGHCGHEWTEHSREEHKER